MATSQVQMVAHYLSDARVDPALDAEIRELLNVCFPDTEIFRTQRWNREVPPHRWIVRDATERMVAHLAGFDKPVFTAENEVVWVGAVAEVAVHPAYRGRGLARTMLAAAHRFWAERGFDFSTLFGKEEVYRSSGYGPVENSFRYFDAKNGEWKKIYRGGFMYARLRAEAAWPTGELDLRGPTW